MIATLPKYDAPVLEDLIPRLTESLHCFRSFWYLSTRSADAVPIPRAKRRINLRPDSRLDMTTPALAKVAPWIRLSM